ncbi:MAG: TSUP family transporter, partial [Bacteroidetes bacterium]|nr:TSUP family transporter [Bacteroidota bacterium]
MPSELILLIPLFAVIAFFYSSVGLGGGSSYTATLAVVGMSYVIIPTLSLTLNILVTAGATWQFARQGHLKLRILAPLLASSIPAAWIGGRLQLSETVFEALLLATLVTVAIRIYFWADPVFRLPQGKAFLLGLSVLLGGLLGFIAGAVGIGGGIYLVPIILMTG